MKSSKSIYIYAQQPPGTWESVGRYMLNASGTGTFIYEPSYRESSGGRAIDPINLPTRQDSGIPSHRYHGLPDALRDACPDSWGQSLLRREHNLPEMATPFEYLLKSSNVDRFGALAIGTSKTPRIPIANLVSVDQLELVIKELIAMAKQQPALNQRIRSRLTQTALGGARPKATIRDENEQIWIAKPRIGSDVTDIPLLEHFGQQWASESGLNFATTVYHPEAEVPSILRVLRFDREKQKRHMCLSAASLLQTEYPGQFETGKWSYPLLAEKLRLIGAPLGDLIELFGRMVFNAMCGNDDDHVRNHAVIYREQEQRWRLTPAFDVVPNPEETPKRLQLQLSEGRFDISRETVLADSHRFGFANKNDAATYLDLLIAGISKGFDDTAHLLDQEWREIMHQRLMHNLALLKKPI